MILLTIGIENGLKRGCKTNLNEPKKAWESERTNLIEPGTNPKRTHA